MSEKNSQIAKAVVRLSIVCLAVLYLHLDILMVLVFAGFIAALEGVDFSLFCLLRRWLSVRVSIAVSLLALLIIAVLVLASSSRQATSGGGTWKLLFAGLILGRTISGATLRLVLRARWPMRVAEYESSIWGAEPRDGQRTAES